jgi:hypothetical protein
VIHTKPCKNLPFFVVTQNIKDNAGSGRLEHDGAAASRKGFGVEATAKDSSKPLGESAMGDKEMQAEGKRDKAKGTAHSAVGDAKNAEERATDK